MRILPGLRSIYDAFWELSSERQSGWSIGEIPTRAIIAYADKYGPHDLDQFDDFKMLIRSMDAAYLEKTTPKDPNDKTAAAARPAMSLGELAQSLDGIRKR